MRELIHRTWNLLRVGKAAWRVRRSNGDEEKRRAQAYLMELLGRSRGLTAKVGQFMALNDSTGSFEDWQGGVRPMPFREVETILDQAYAGKFRALFKKVWPEGRPASLGQVHRARLRDGREVAVKVQYPGIRATVESELRLLGWMPEAGPVRRWGFDWGDYVNSFHDQLNRELDYPMEAARQADYRKRSGPVQGLVVPEVIESLTRPQVLVQAFETGKPLEEAVRAPALVRQSLGRILLKHYLYMLFQEGVVHSDPNPANFAFRWSSGKEEVVLYDYGSVFEIPREERLVLLKIIWALQNRQDVNPMACLAALGFAVDKLQDLRPCLGALLAILFEPFLEEGDYDVREWELNRRVDQVAGEMKWWFRSAAPARWVFLMRTLHGLVRLLQRLEVRLPWKWVLYEAAGEALVEAGNRPLPDLPEGLADGLSFRGLARYLKVDVIKGENNRIVLTLPARVVDELEEIIDRPVLEAIRKQNIDLAAIQKRVRATGYAAQTLFEMEDEIRKVRVWLE